MTTLVTRRPAGAATAVPATELAPPTGPAPATELALRPSPAPARRPLAVVWVGPDDAILVRRIAGGRAESTLIRRISLIEDELTFLARISHELGPDPDVIVLGGERERTVFERMDVAIHHRPERLAEGHEADAQRPQVAELVARLPAE